MITVASIDHQVEQLFDVLTRVAAALTKARIEYRVIGGVAIFLHIERIDPIAARLTRDVDIAVSRADLERIAEAVRPFGFEYRHTAGLDMLVNAAAPKARSAVHLVFVGEKVRPDSVEPVPPFSPAISTKEGVLLAPVLDLLRMKLTSFREKDRVHIRDMDSVGLITPDLEHELSDVLRERLRQVRATE